MKSQLDMVLDIADPNDEYRFLFQNKRCKLPTAKLYPDKFVESKPGSTLLVIKANKPALIRYALLLLISHEKAHHKFLEEFPDFEGEHHTHPRFLEIEKSFVNEIDEAICREHD